ncbi:MAG: bstEII [Muribaculaceae bacterium]|nr:bstEII [Muribaculaceae bacterium]
MKTFADYKSDASNWITMTDGEFYPDILPDACELYKPVLVLFGQLLKKSESSEALLYSISSVTQPWMRIQLCRVFRKYVSPQTPVEMLKKKSLTSMICAQYGKKFRPVNQVQAAFDSRPLPDEALCAILWEYKDRGQKGYDLTEKFFNLFRAEFPEYLIEGPERAGADIMLHKVLTDYPNKTRPVDFIIRDTTGKICAVGMARYDGDRGGAQEDDRPGGYMNFAHEILSYSNSSGQKLKVIYINDGPGLLLGSMWDDYAKLEEISPEYIKVVTLRMIKERISSKWLSGK